MPHCPVTVVQRYRDGVCSLLFHLFFIICHPYIPLDLYRRNFFLYLFYPFLTVLNAPSKTMLEYRCIKEMLIPPFPCSRIFFVMQHAGIELGPHATLYTLCYTHLSNTTLNFIIRGRSRRGTLSKMASFIVDTSH